MKAFLIVAVFVGAVAGGWAMATRPSACEQLDALCAQPSVSNLNAVFACSMVGMARLGGQMNERKCASVLAEIKK